MTPLDDLKLTDAQAQILRWLRLYPEVTIEWTGGKDRPMIMPWWANDEARKHMISTIAHLGMESESVASNPGGGTPNLRTPTFQFLRREGLIKIARSRKPMKNWSPMDYYTISDRGMSALLMRKTPRQTAPDSFTVLPL